MCLQTTTSFVAGTIFACVYRFSFEWENEKSSENRVVNEIGENFRSLRGLV